MACAKCAALRKRIFGDSLSDETRDVIVGVTTITLATILLFIGHRLFSKR